jgi:CubicO group peptidase (beta-lactamase class C family)
MRLITIFLLLLIQYATIAQKKDEFDKYLQQRMQSDSIPGASLLIIHNNTVVKKAALGYSNLENMVPASQQTVYELASVSKPITATAMMMLVEEGKLILDSSVAFYLGSIVTDNYKTITVRMLLNHTSGIPSDHYAYTKLYAPTPLRYNTKDQLNDLFALKPVAAPGEKYLYSNAGFFLQAAILEKITGSSYQDFVQTRIFNKAGMKHSYSINADSIIPNHAQGYTKRRGHMVRFSLEGTIQALTSNGFGGLMSTTSDLQAFTTALLHGTLIQKETLAQMLIPSQLKGGAMVAPKPGSHIGLAWHIKTIAGKRCIFHTGHTGTALLCFPDEDLTVVLLTNLSFGYSMFGDKGFKVMDVGFDLAEMAAKRFLK